MVNTKNRRSFRFIDLFCGIGGFHQALASIGGRCVFACDIDEQCRKVYSQNFCPNGEFPVDGDIRVSIDNDSIPPFDFLCAGFPCQTFSKAGNRNGFAVIQRSDGTTDERGQLFFRIIDILEKHPECKFFLLENVRNLADNKENWAVICEELKKLDFIISEDPIIESPHHFGVPQIRERVYILGIRKNHFDNRRNLPIGYLTRDVLHLDQYLQPCSNRESCLSTVMDSNVHSRYLVPEDINQLLSVWEELRENTEGLSRPFWLQYAGIGIKTRSSYLSAPSISFNSIPEWKQRLVLRMRVFYENNMRYIDRWVDKYRMMDKILLHQKFEWNAGDSYSMKECIIQIRQSGVRVKRPNFFPSLVAMNNTPIVWDPSANHYRYFTPHECAKLQSFTEGYKFSEIDSVTYRQLGNSVNVRILSILASELVRLGKKL